MRSLLSDAPILRGRITDRFHGTQRLNGEGLSGMVLNLDPYIAGIDVVIEPNHIRQVGPGWEPAALDSRFMSMSESIVE